MPLIRIDDLDDPRLEPYRHLRMRNLTRHSGRFIAESRLLVERLLRSDYDVESILVVDNQLDLLAHVPDSIHRYVVASNQVSQLLGFEFHRGVLACGRRKRLLEVEEAGFAEALPEDWTGVFLIGVQDPENMGLIARTCAALGIQDLLLGPQCVDPYARRVLRVSMGSILKLRLFSVRNPLSILDFFSRREVALIATSLGANSLRLEEFGRRQAALILFGNEAEGLPDAIQERADYRLRIDMRLDTDSLNVSVAAGIVMHYLTRLAQPKKWDNSIG